MAVYTIPKDQVQLLNQLSSSYTEYKQQIEGLKIPKDSPLSKQMEKTSTILKTILGELSKQIESYKKASEARKVIGLHSGSLAFRLIENLYAWILNYSNLESVGQSGNKEEIAKEANLVDDRISEWEHKIKMRKIQ